MAKKPLGIAGKTLDKAIAAQQAGNRVLAENLFQTVLRSKPDCVDALYLLGTLRAEAGQLDSAAALLERAARLQPDSPYIANNLGNVHRLRGRPREAAQAFAAALARKPDLVEAELNLGVLYRRMGRAEEAERHLRAVLAQRPAWLEARTQLGVALDDQGRHEEAFAELRAVLDEAPDHAQAHELLGLRLARLGRDDEAAAHLERFVALAGDQAADSEAALALARLGRGARPDRFPRRAMLRTYERKAAGWDDDVRRPGMEFLGPGHVADYLARHHADSRDLRIADLGCGTGLCGPLLRPLARRLAGVDLSAPMLEQAAAKGCYDELHCEDLERFLRERPAAFDLLVASGVMILFGELEPVLGAAAAALRPAGRLMFTAYRSEGQDIGVRGNLHFSHSPAYLARAAASAGLVVDELLEVTHEYDYGVPQPGFVVVLATP